MEIKKVYKISSEKFNKVQYVEEENIKEVYVIKYDDGTYSNDFSEYQEAVAYLNSAYNTQLSKWRKEIEDITYKIISLKRDLSRFNAAYELVINMERGKASSKNIMKGNYNSLAEKYLLWFISEFKCQYIRNVSKKDGIIALKIMLKAYYKHLFEKLKKLKSDRDHIRIKIKESKEKIKP